MARREVSLPITPLPFDELLDDVVGEAASLRRLLANLSEQGWERSTPAVGWAVRDQISHLAYFDEAATLALRDPRAFVAEGEALAHRGPRADVVAADHRHLSGAQLLAWFDRARAALVGAYRGVDPRSRVPWYGPPMSVMSSATARLMETWAHGVDVADALGVPLEDSPRLRHVAHLGVRTMGFSFSHHGQDPPSVGVRVELAGADEAQWVFAAGEAGEAGEAREVVRGRALDFCLVVTQRRHVDETGLEVEGVVAREWMLIAQAFAGPPTQRSGST